MGRVSAPKEVCGAQLTALTPAGGLVLALAIGLLLWLLLGAVALATGLV